MDIEIPKQERMTETGSSLLRLIQNKNTPLLDLFVRESIQNSLDAHKDNIKFVNVEYIIGKFDSHSFNSELTGISNFLDKKFPDSSYDFLAIKDTNTVGLTGPVTEDKVENDDFGNLLKLVYHISKPQANNGAGGSWGLGKTVYFRIGIGLVVYYSRIKTKTGIEDRLVATLVENEKDPCSYLKSYSSSSKRGIAWWGKYYDQDKKTIPVTDQKIITEVLGNFHLNLFNETGTMVIIPYIDKSKLCKVNQFNELEGNTKYAIPSWCSDLKEFLKVSTERWYCCRLNNSSYKYGPYLRLAITDEAGTEVIAKSKMEPIFNLLNEYSKYGYSGEWNSDNEYGFEKPEKEIISYQKYLKQKEAGTLLFSKIKVKDLKMSYSPLMYLNEGVSDEEGNPPIIAYIRQPGMIISYDHIGHWVKGIPNTTEDEVLLGLFILNSENAVCSDAKQYSLEEYIRLSELADHFSWKDHLICDGIDTPIIEKIQSKVRTRIKKEYFEKPDDSKIIRNDALSQKLGELLLPRRGFGNAAISRVKEKIEKTKTTPTGNSKTYTKIVILEDNIEYKKDFISIPVKINFSKKSTKKDIHFTVSINTESKVIPLDEWETSMNLEKPFEIENIHTDITINNEISSSLEIDKVLEEYTFTQGKIILSKTDKGSKNMVSVYINNTDEIEIVMYLNIRIFNRDYQPVIKW